MNTQMKWANYVGSKLHFEIEIYVFSSEDAEWDFVRDFLLSYLPVVKKDLTVLCVVLSSMNIPFLL